MAQTDMAAGTAQQHRPSLAVPLVVAGAVALAGAALSGWPELLASGLRDQVVVLLTKPLSLTWIVGVPALLLLERLRPIDKPSYGDPDVLMSIFYSLIAAPAIVVSVGFLADWQKDWIAENISLVDLDFFQSWHPAAVSLFAFVTSDFLLWLTHLVMHKNERLWRVHEIHHSTTRLNLFASDRAHPGETIFRHFAALLVISVIGPSVIDAEWLAINALFVGWWLKFVHSNVRLSLGPLRYLLVTPQSHRIHHSTKQEHWDSNYGFILSTWDWIFRTQNADRTSYPATGVDQPTFPHPRSRRPGELLSAFAAQQTWPARRD